MNQPTEKIIQILDYGTSKEKIKVLESLVNSNDSQIINKIVSKLDDSDIKIRGEAFSSLILNKNNISKIIIKNLNSESKNIRGFGSLVLANRKDTQAIPAIINLTKDQSGMVRTCALGALGFLKAKEATNEIHQCFSDSNLEVKKSALKAAMDIGDKIDRSEFDKLQTEKDEELELLLVQAQKL